jgi:hypothetical protein
MLLEQYRVVPKETLKEKLVGRIKSYPTSLEPDQRESLQAVRRALSTNNLLDIADVPDHAPESPSLLLV